MVLAIFYQVNNCNIYILCPQTHFTTPSFKRHSGSGRPTYLLQQTNRIAVHFNIPHYFAAYTTHKLSTFHFQLTMKKRHKTYTIYYVHVIEVSFKYNQFLYIYTALIASLNDDPKSLFFWKSQNSECPDSYHHRTFFADAKG